MKKLLVFSAIITCFSFVADSGNCTDNSAKKPIFKVVYDNERNENNNNNDNNNNDNNNNVNNVRRPTFMVTHYSREPMFVVTHYNDNLRDNSSNTLDSGTIDDSSYNNNSNNGNNNNNNNNSNNSNNRGNNSNNEYNSMRSANYSNDISYASEGNYWRDDHPSMTDSQYDEVLDNLYKQNYE